jgi:hypothetical protein
VLEIHAPSRSLFNAAIVVVCLLALSHFVLCANLKRTREWFYDADTKSAMKIIEERTESMSHNASISNHWLFEPSINYYIISRGMKLNPATRDGVNLNSDFIYRLDDNSDLEHFTVLADYKETNSNLLTKN